MSFHFDAISSWEKCRKGFNFCWRSQPSEAIVEPKSTQQKIDFWVALHIRGTSFHAFKTSDEIGHTCVGPQKLRWPKAPRSLNPSLIVSSCRYWTGSLYSSKEPALLNGWRQESLHYLPCVCWADTSVLCSPGSKAYKRDASFWKIKYQYQWSASKIGPKQILQSTVFRWPYLSWHAVNSCGNNWTYSLKLLIGFKEKCFIMCRRETHSFSSPFFILIQTIKGKTWWILFNTVTRFMQ